MNLSLTPVTWCCGQMATVRWLRVSSFFSSESESDTCSTSSTRASRMLIWPVGFCEESNHFRAIILRQVPVTINFKILDNQKISIDVHLQYRCIVLHQQMSKVQFYIHNLKVQILYIKYKFSIDSILYIHLWYSTGIQIDPFTEYRKDIVYRLNLNQYYLFPSHIFYKYS